MLNNVIEIKYLLNLKNVNFERLILWGLARKLIDDKFVVKFAESIISSEYSNEVWLEIAGLNKDQLEALVNILEMSNSRNASQEEKQLYNRIWFYVIVASQLNDDNFLS